MLNQTVRVRRQGQNVPGSLSWQSANVLRFEVEQPPFANGEYDVTVTDGVVSLSTAGGPVRRLDGEPKAQWPTGDGNPGGTFQFGFAVS
jgi:hypothetical protein